MLHHREDAIKRNRVEGATLSLSRRSWAVTHRLGLARSIVDIGKDVLDVGVLCALHCDYSNNIASQPHVRGGGEEALQILIVNL